MKVRTTRIIENSVYIVKLETLDFSPSDVDLMRKFGEPEIELGGSFTTPPVFTLPTQQRKLKSGFPHIQKFDGNTNPDAESNALQWATTLLARITAAVSDLRANADTFTSESVVTL